MCADPNITGGFMSKKYLVLYLLVWSALLLVTCDKSTGPGNETNPIELVVPKGGECYQAGQTVKIVWKINDPTYISSVGIKLSLDNGRSFFNILESSSIFPPDTSFSWVITDEQISSQCIIKVYDYISDYISDKSGVFTISNQ